MRKLMILMVILCVIGLVGCSSFSNESNNHNIIENQAPPSSEAVIPPPVDINSDPSIDVESEDLDTKSYENTPVQAQSFESLTFTIENYPELDFGMWSHDGGYMIRDFAFTPQNTILLLQMSGVVSEYDFSGNLIGIYDLKLSEQGLSAFRVCAGLQDTIYLLDGRNNSILTCNREEVMQISRVDWNDLGLAKNYFECDQDGRPCLSATHPSLKVPGNVLASFTYALNVDDDCATIEETITGCGIAGGVSFQISKLDESLGTRELSFDIYNDGVFNCRISVSTDSPEDLPIIGADFLGIINHQYLIKIIEVKCLPDSYQEYISSSFLLVDKDTGFYQMCECTMDDNAIIRYIDNETFYLNRNAESMSIVSITQACHNLTETEYFNVSVTDIEK